MRRVDWSICYENRDRRRQPVPLRTHFHPSWCPRAGQGDCVGHNHDVVLPCPSLNSQGAGVSSSLAQRALPLSRNYSLKFFGNTGVSARTGNSYGLVGILVQYRWGAGL